MLKKSLSVLLVGCLVLSLAACGSNEKTSDQSSDILITNAEVYTVDAENTVAEAVAVKDGKITYVGDAAGAEEFKGKDTKVIDLKGGSVMPSMVDAHMHPAQSAATYMYEIPLYDVGTTEEYKKIIKEFVDENPDLETYAGAGFMRSMFDSVGPRASFLDELCPDKPMMITSADGHSIWANSKAFELSGITKESKDPEGGVIQRDPVTGEPSGLLQESAMQLLDDLKPVYTKDQYKEAILWLQEWFNSVGITTIFDAMVPIDKPDYYNAYNELAEEGKLTLKIRGGWHLYPEIGDEAALEEAVDKGIELSKGFTTPYFQVNTFKFFADQVVEEATAYMSEPYSDRTDGWKGIKVWDDEVLANLYTKVDKAGFQTHTHQIGDAAATYALDALEKAVGTNGERDSRHTFAHVQFLKEDDMQRMADLKMNAIIAPYWMAMDDYYWDIYKPMLGERVDNMYPAKSLFDSNINTAIHSDFFVTEPDPGWLFYGATTRTLPKKMYNMWYGEDAGFERTTDVNAPVTEGMIGPLKQHEERLSLDQTVKAATYNGAYSMFMENEIGSIEEGKVADLMVFSNNIFDLEPEDLANVLPIMTLFDGKIVYEKE